MVDPALISLRPATAADFDFLWNLHRRAMRESVDNVYGWEDAWQLNYFSERFDSNKRQIILYDQQAVGGLGLEWGGKALIIAYIAINPDHQGQGLGTAVISDIIHRGTAAGLQIKLDVLHGNPAKGLYEQLGFVTADELETRYQMVYQPTK